MWNGCEGSAREGVVAVNMVVAAMVAASVVRGGLLGGEMGRWVLDSDGVCGGFWAVEVEVEERRADEERMVAMGLADSG